MNCTFLIEVREETKADIFNFFTQKSFECTWIDYKETIITKGEEIPGFANLIFRSKESAKNI